MRAGHSALGLCLAWLAGGAGAQVASPGTWPLLAPSASPTARYASPLTTQAGDPVRGRRLVVDRKQGFCLLCHSGPFPEERFQGTLGPDLSLKAGHRVSAEVRTQLLAPTLFNPDTIMPAYGQPATTGLRVHPQFQGKPLLQPQDIEDIVAFLVQMTP